MSELITSRLASVRDKHVMVAASTGCALCVSLLLVWTMVVMWLDWNVPNGLPRWIRAVLLLGELVAFGYLFYRRIMRPVKNAPDDEEVALMLERRWPEFNTRAIAAVQLTDPDARVTGSRTLIGAMVRQAEQLPTGAALQKCLCFGLRLQVESSQTVGLFFRGKRSARPET